MAALEVLELLWDQELRSTGLSCQQQPPSASARVLWRDAAPLVSDCRPPDDYPTVDYPTVDDPTVDDPTVDDPTHDDPTHDDL